MILRDMVRDHVVAGRPILPAAVALELIVAALRRPRGCLEAITFHRPAVLTRRGELALRLELEHNTVRLADPANGRVYCDARIGDLRRSAGPVTAPAPGVMSRMEALDRDAVYDWFAGLGVSYGRWFRALQDIRRSGFDVRARVASPGGDGFVLHPSLVDGALQAIGCAAFGRSGPLFVPYAIGRLEWFGALDAEVDVEARVTSTSDDRISGEARLLNGGQVAAVLSDVTLKRLGGKSGPAVDDVLHEIVLIPAPASAAQPRVWQWCGAGEGPPAGDEEPRNLVYAAGHDQEAVADFLAWARAVRRGRVAVVAPFGSPAGEAVLGAARALRLERPDLHVRAVAVVPGTTRARVIEELERDEPEIVLDRESRSIRAFRRIASRQRPFVVPRGGAAVITGGYGGIGLAVARWLFERCGARMLLVGRRGMADDPAAREAVLALRAMGAEVMAAAADVADRVAMSRVLRQARETLGPFHAVFHAAGVLRDGLLGRKTDADVRAVLAPKMRGTQVLDEITADDPLVAFVLFSSVVSYTGNFGQTDYAAANRFLDAYARRRRSEGRPFQSIAFGPWGEIGMAVPHLERARRQGIEPLSPALALDALERALSTDRAEILVAHVTDTLAQAGVTVLPASHEPAIAAPHAAVTTATPPAPAAAAPPAPPAVGIERDTLERLLLTEVARFLEVEPEYLDADADIADYGVDSILGVQLLRDLERRLDRPIDPVLLFETRTITALAARLASESAAVTRPATGQAAPTPRTPAASAPAVAPDAVSTLPAPHDAIAVIGFAARLPGSPDLDTFFDGLMSGRSFIREIPRERFDVARYFDAHERPGTTRTKWAALVDDIDRFDPLFHGISPREAALMDPQQRLLLDVAWDALEHAGYGPRLAGSRTGVFVGGSHGEYGHRFFTQPQAIDAHTAIGNSTSILANRLSYAFDLKGPSVVVDTACSSSLVAVHLARQSLLQGESELALAAGVNVLLRPETFIAFSRAQLLSPTGRARPFAADADGYVRAEAAAVLVLKPLDRARADGDTIHAVLLGSAVAQDGRTMGLTTPDAVAEADVMTRALGGIDPGSLDYIEAHAVGSRIGDSIELEAIGRVRARCPVGSVKGNVGHAEVASGLVSVVKVLLGFERGVMPPVASADLAATGERRVLSTAATLPPAARVLVNAFGFGGTNAAVVLERPWPAPCEGDTGGDHLLLLSARSETALTAAAARLRHTLERSNDDIADICFTQSTGRRLEPFRAAAIGDRLALRSALAGVAPVRSARKPRIAFLFTGQGSQYVGMGRDLFDHVPVFRAGIERCERLLEDRLTMPLRRILFEADPEGRINQTLNTQPALFAIEWALVETWRAAGVEPGAVLGHSVGEIVAATVAGAMTLEEGLQFTFERAAALQRLPGGGGMAVLKTSAEKVAALVDPYGSRCSIAAVNGPEFTTIGGDSASIDAILARAAQLDILGRRLSVSHAFHSPLVEPALAELERAAAAVDVRRLRLPLASNLFGRLLPAGDTLDAAYWRRHAREPVRFLEGLRALDVDLLLEIGPDAVLTPMASAALGASNTTTVSSLRRGRAGRATMLEAVKALFLAGADVDAGVLSTGRRRVPVPASVRESRRVWFDSGGELPAPAVGSAPSSSAGLRDILREEVARVLKLDPGEVSTSTPLAHLGLDSLLAIELAARVEGRLGRKLPLDGVQEDASLDDLVAEVERDGAPSRPEPPPAPADAGPIDPDAYARYARPAIMERLVAGALDKVYVEARGDRLVFVENGERVEVVDAVGGFGSTLFGHNHPALVAHQKACLDGGMPVHTQGSHRAQTGRLAAALSRKLASGGRCFVSTFANSGAEAVESAIKHAEMEYAARGDRIVHEASRRMACALHDVGDVPLGDSVAAALGLDPGATLAQGIGAIEAHNARVLGEPPVFLALERAFHGKTAAAARLTARAGYRTRFAGGIRVERLPADDARVLEARASTLVDELYVLAESDGRLELERHPWTRIAALFVEPVQGEGGVRPLTRRFLAGARGVADRHGFPIVADEIQTGFGRCGAFSAAQRLGLEADYYLFGKALGGGLAKIAVLLVDEARYVPEFGLTATSTFSEDDISVTTALAALDLYDGDSLETRVGQVGDRLLRGLEDVKRRHPAVFRDVRGLGLLIGVELAEPASFASSLLRHLDDNLGQIAASWLLNVARIRTLPTASAPGTIRLEPSAYLSQADQDRILAAFERLAEIMEHGNVAHLVGHLAGLRLDGSRPITDWRHAPGHDIVPAEAGDARAAFVTYFTEDDDLLDFCPAASELPAAARRELIERMHRLIPPRVVRSARVRSRDGRTVHVEMIGLMATSALIEASMRAGDLGWIRDRIDEAVDLAIDRGASVVGFGGLTSIVTRNARLAASSKIALTTGNSLTVAMALEGLARACRSADIDPDSARVAIVGAAGNLGATCAECLAEAATQLVLIGRRTSRAKLTQLADSLYAGAAARLRVRGNEPLRGIAAVLETLEDVRRLATGPEPVSGAEVRMLVEACLGPGAPIVVAEGLDALGRANVVLAASNAARPIIEPEHLADGPVVVCDVAVPRDVSPRVRLVRPDVRVIVGGAVRLPGETQLDFVAGHLPRGHVYACMAETMLLGLEGIRRHFSFGPVRRDAVLEIARVAAAHGFTLGVVEDGTVPAPSVISGSLWTPDDRTRFN